MHKDKMYFCPGIAIVVIQFGDFDTFHIDVLPNPDQIRAFGPGDCMGVQKPTFTRSLGYCEPDRCRDAAFHLRVAGYMIRT